MTQRMHRVGDYDYSIDAGTGEPGRLRLWRRDGRQLAVLGFVAGDAAVPPPTLTSDLSCASAFVRMSALAPLLDMLRSAAVVYVTLDDRPPGFVRVHTRRPRRLPRAK